MYEHFKNEVIRELIGLPTDDVERVIRALDKVSYNYEIAKKETQLIVYEDLARELVQMYIECKRLEGLSGKSLKLYAGRLKIFFEWVNKEPLDVEARDIRNFLSNYQKFRGITDRTLDKFRQIINGFFTWLTDEEYMAKNPCRNIKEIKYEVSQRPYLTRLQLELFRRCTTNKRDLAIVDTLYSTGCRVSELTNMRISQIDTENKCIEIIGKGKKHNIVYFNTNAQISLNEYIESRTDNSDYLFVNFMNDKHVSVSTVEHLFKKLSEIAGVKATPHTMRHTNASLALQSGMEITTVQRMLGHSSVATTQIYAEMAQDDLKNAHLKYVI